MVQETSEKSNELLLKYRQSASFSEKLKVLVAGLATHKKQPWSALPWQNQFIPLIWKYGRRFPWLKQVNPSMSHYSGLIEVPKSEINKHLKSEFMPISVLVEQKMGFEAFTQFMKHHKLVFPIICKPNAGERSAGVKFLQNESDLKNFVDTAPDESFLVQEFLTQSKEFGIVVERKSVHSKQFRVVSCVEKQARKITGNGKNSVEILVGKLPITESQKETILVSISDTEKQEVLKKDEVRKIARTASVSLGTVFVDRQDEVTELLEKAVSAPLKDYAGFNVGRFDIMANSLKEIEQGNYKIIELNGVGAQPLNIYEAHRSVYEVYEILENYYDLLLVWGKKNASRKKLKISDFMDFLRSVYPAVKKQKTSSLVKKTMKQNFGFLWKSFWRMERKLFVERIKRFF